MVHISQKGKPMKLLKDTWVPMFQHVRELEKSLGKRFDMNLSRQEAAMEADYRAAEVLMTISETIVIPSGVIMDLIHNLKSIDTKGWISLPYPYVTIQFTQPILETDFMPHEEVNDLMRDKIIERDRVVGVILGNARQDTKYFPPMHVFNMMNCCVLFESTSVNRVAWEGTAEAAKISWDRASFSQKEIPPGAFENKMRMIHICYAINLFLNAPNVTVVKQRQDPKVQRKREAKGKAKLPEYHTVVIEKVQVKYTSQIKGSGTPHGRLYPVRGHFRKYKHLEKPVWVPNHFRGLAHAQDGFTPSVYKIKED